MDVEWVVCPECRLRHRVRVERRCPRCGAALSDTTSGPSPDIAASTGVTAPLPEPPPTPQASPAPPGARSAGAGRRAALALAAVVLVGAGGWEAFQLARPGAQAVATFARGRVTVAELEAEVRAMPPGLRRSSLRFLGELASALAYRRALAEHAREQGLSTDARGELGERELVRALLRQEGLSAPERRQEARDHLKRFWSLVERAVGGKVHVDMERLSRVAVGKVGPVPAPKAARGAEQVEPYFLDDPSLDGGAVCSGEIHGDGLWYTVGCDVAKNGLEALGPYHVLYLESTYGPTEGFLHGYVDDGWREEVILLRTNARTITVSAATAPAEFLGGYRATLGDVSTTGSVDVEEARRHFERAAGAVEHCLGEHHWNIRYPEREGEVVLELKLMPGDWSRGTVKKRGLTAPTHELYREVGGSAAALDRMFIETSCLHPLQVFALSGVGSVTYTVRIRAPYGAARQ